jgi:hypothetical protein
MAGFDFDIDESGELVINEQEHEINKVTDDELRIQLAYTRIKSIAHGWFYDEVGADLEELVGRSIKESTIEYGKEKIINVLTFDNLWNENDILVISNVQDSTHLIYSVYLKTYTTDEFGEKSVELTIELDLIKGVKIKFGW